MPTKAELEKIARDAQAKLYEIEKTERDEKNASLMGKCVRYRNSYGSDERWWLYGKILRSEDGDLIIHQFETTSRGEISIKPEYRRYYSSLETGGWESISREKFDFEWNGLISRLLNMR